MLTGERGLPRKRWRAKVRAHLGAGFHKFSGPLLRTMIEPKQALKSVLRKFDLALVKAASLDHMLKTDADMKFLMTMSDSSCAAAILQNFPLSKSQLRQDLFVLSELQFKRGGSFVEFGATDGVGLSNTHLMEKEFGWSGILAEPAHSWHSQLSRNRTAAIEHECVWSKSGLSLEFNEVDDAELSTVASVASGDAHDRQSGSRYLVKTISLDDMLDRHHAPQDIDYLSIDTEGSEYEILSAFDFGKHSFKVITCEHNYTPAREKIFTLLSRNGYTRKFEEISGFDDWYVRQ